MAFVRNPVLQSILICAFLVGITYATGAQAVGINIPRHLKLGECSITPENTHKVCRDMEGKYRTWPLENKGGEAPITKKEQLKFGYFECLYYAFGRGEIGDPAFQKCLDSGIELCNGEGIPTSQTYKISPITGRVNLSNDQCGTMLNGFYMQAEHIFLNEYEHYSRAEAVRATYKPVIINLLKYVGY